MPQAVSVTSRIVASAVRAIRIAGPPLLSRNPCNLLGPIRLAKPCLGGTHAYEEFAAPLVMQYARRQPGSAQQIEPERARKKALRVTVVLNRDLTVGVAQHVRIVGYKRVVGRIGIPRPVEVAESAPVST